MKFAFLFFLSSISLFSLQVNIENKCLEVEVAGTEKLRAQGLQNRDYLEKSKGMLFIFPAPTYASFWMKDTYIDLSIAFFDEDKKLVQIEKMPIYKANQPLKTYKSIAPIKYAIEVNMGWFEENDIKVGDTLYYD